MKNILGLGVIMAVVVMLAGCSQSGVAEGSDLIAVVSREQGSGTRNSMEEILDINTNEDNRMVESAIIRDGNGVVATQIMGNAAAIGYVSFATVTANEGSLIGLYVNGVAPTAENILNGTYEISRDFDMVFPDGELTELQAAFLEFIQSTQGLQALESADTIVDMEGAEVFDRAAHAGLSGTLSLGGSTSTERAVTAVTERFMAMFPQVSINYNSVGSGAGIQGAQDGRFDIGFSSRSVLESELGEGFDSTTICRDGIVFVVHPNNEIRDLTVEQIRDVYMGNITLWSELD